MGKGITPPHASTMHSRIGMRSGIFSFIYLGVPIFVGAPKTKWLKAHADRIIAKMEA